MNTSGSWWYIEVLWSETINLCRKLNIIYNIITCNPEPQANGLEWCLVHKWIILLNWFTKSNWIVWNSLQLEQHRSTSYSIKTHFQTPESHSYSKWAKIAAYLILRWMNWFSSSSSNSPWTEETDRLGPKTDEPLIWACVNREREQRVEMKVFNGFSLC